jgi:molecular chaperone DnaJ
MPRDYYDVLSVPRGASKAAIKQRYRALALELHPDRNPDPGAAERFKEVSEAYAVLSDDAKRAAYDRFGHQGVGQRWATEEDLFRGVDFEDLFGGFGFTGFEDLFERFFGVRPGAGGRRRRGRDVEAPVQLTLEEVLAGARKTVEVQRRVACEACEGSGAARGTKRTTCPTCRGSGQARSVRGGGAFQFVQVGPCPSCRGAGSTLEHPCKPCEGQGLVLARGAVEVAIPPGVDTGSVLQLRGQGEAGPQGAPPGDLFVVCEVQPHERFERRGADLVTLALVPFPTAALGGAFELELLDGKREKVQVLPGTQGGSVLTLDGLGLPDGRGRRGDLHVLLQIAVPTKLSPKARDLLRQMASEAGGPAPKANLREALQDVLGKLGRRDEEAP